MSQVDSADNPARPERLSCFRRGSPACQRIESAGLPPLCFRCRPTCALATATGLVPSLAQLSGRGHLSIPFQRKRLGPEPKRSKEPKAALPSGRVAEGSPLREITRVLARSPHSSAEAFWTGWAGGAQHPAAESVHALHEVARERSNGADFEGLDQVGSPPCLLPGGSGAW